MVDTFRKGKRAYTHWDKKSEQVTVTPRKKQPPQENSLDVDIPPELVSGKSANQFIVHHSADEFVVDCGFLPPSPSKLKMSARLIMSPSAAKKLAVLLAKALDDSERRRR